MSYTKRSLQVGLVLLAWVGVGVAQQEEAQLPREHVGRVVDWSYHHLVSSGGLAAADLDAAKTEPRLLYHLAERNLGWLHRPPRRPRSLNKIDGSRSTNKKNLEFDWSVSLGTGNVAANMFPAKFNFDANSVPDCVNDYVVYGLNVAGVNNGQANLVGINKLYSGAGGICGANPAVNWAYNGSTAGGSVLTSTVISLDGTKVAYVESTAGSSIFHVLTWKAGEGTVTKAVTPVTGASCTLTSSCLQSVTYSATNTNTFASTWVDYATDKGFVASDGGNIYRISCVFKCALGVNPTVDWTYTLPVAGTGGAQPKPNGPVYNSPYGYLIIGDQLGEVWVINAGGSTPSLHAGPVMVGGGGCTTTNPPGRTGTPSPCTPAASGYGIPDSLILDASGASERVYAFSGNDGTAAVVAQMTQDLTGLVRVHIGQGTVNIHTGAFDNNYWGNSPSTGNLFVCGTGAADTTPYHYWIGFTSYPVINSTPTSSLQRLNAAGVPCAPYTEFYNPNLNLGGVAGHHDLLVSGLVDPVNGYIITNDISTGTITSALNFVQYRGGISGVVIDNNSTMAQASSVYFSTLQNSNVGTCGGTRCAVKLTQAALQ